MKAIIVAATGCLLLTIGHFAFADCNNYGCPPPGCYGNQTICQCTDPYCNSVDNTCLSKEACCEAFGNVGGR